MLALLLVAGCTYDFDRFDAAGGGDGGAGGPCNPASCPGHLCTDGACADYGSCKALLAGSPGVASGVYEIATASGAFKAYCDMTTSGGGWTLAGRSVASASKNDTFGWIVQRGTPDDDTQAYSLDPIDRKLSFTEVLVGSVASGKAFANAYVVTVPKDLTGCLTQACGTSNGAVAAGSCSPATGSTPSMLRNLGFTSQNRGFFMHDTGTQASYGLLANGFSLFYATCNEGGLLDGQQGMIFVR